MNFDEQPNNANLKGILLVSPQGYDALPQYATPQEIRTWAKANGVPVGERGRINKTLVAKYSQERNK